MSSPPLVQLNLIKVEDIPREQVKMGDCWYANPNSWVNEHHRPWYYRHADKSVLSDAYFAQNSHRMPICVMMPGMLVFCVDSKTFSQGVYSGGWTVTGDPTNLTVSPSINMSGVYHGWIQNGWITTDVDGHVYDANWERVYPGEQ